MPTPRYVLLACGLSVLGCIVAPAQYTISTVAGGAVPTNVPGTSTALAPARLAADRFGNIYFAENSAVFKLGPSGAAVAVAGNRTSRDSGDNGPALAAQLGSVADIAVDGGGNVYIADLLAGRVRKVGAASGVIASVAGGGWGDDRCAAVNAWLGGPSGVAVDGAGNLYIAEYYQNRIRKVSASSGLISTVAGNGVAGFAGDGGPALEASLNGPQDLELDATGNLYFVDAYNQRVRRIDAGMGTITTVAGGAGISPAGIALDPAGNLYIADSAGRVWLSNATTHALTTFADQSAGLQGAVTSVALDAAGNVYIADGRLRKVNAATRAMTTLVGGGSAGDGGPALAAHFGSPQTVAVDAAGNLFIADQSRVRKVAAGSGTISAFAVATANVVGLGVDGTGSVLVLDARGSLSRAAAAGSLTALTTAAGGLRQPAGIAADAGGNVWVADATGVRRIDAGTGAAASIAGVGGGAAVAVDAAGNLYVADSSGNAVRRVDAASGIVTTVAGNGDAGYWGDGGPAAQANLNHPAGVVVDAAGNVYINDSGNSAIRKVDALTGLIGTIAGTGAWGFSGDGGNALAAGIDPAAAQIAVDAQGQVYFAEAANARVRRVTPVPVDPLAIWSDPVLPDGVVGAPYYAGNFATVGGVPPYTAWTVSGGALPAGLSVDGGVLQGTPVIAGVYSFTIAVGDSAGNTAASSYTLAIRGRLPDGGALLSPANGVSRTGDTQMLAWTEDPYASSYDIYFGACPNPPYVASVATASYVAHTPAGTYCWGVAAANSAGTRSYGAWSFTSNGMPAPAKVAVFRAGLWVIDRNGDFAWNGAPPDQVTSLGQAGDIAVTGDWNGDGRQKAGIFRSGLWLLDYNGNGQWDGPSVDRAISLGQTGDVPVVGDWNGDGRAKVGIFRNGLWVLDYNGNGQWDDVGIDRVINLGQQGDVPVVGDWNGDGRAKAGVFRNGLWVLDYNGNGQWDGPGTDRVINLGQPGDVPVTGDWNGDGRTKAGIFRAGLWVLDYNGNGQWDGPGSDRVINLGQSGDVPVTGDWNGDGRAKAGIFRAGLWVLDYNGNGQWDGPGSDRCLWLGQGGDTAVAAKW